MADAWLNDLLSVFCDVPSAAWSACLQDTSRKGLNGLAVEAFTGSTGKKGCPVYLWTSEHIEPREVTVKRTRQVVVEETIPEEERGSAEEKKGEGDDADAPRTRRVTRDVEETVKELQRVVVHSVNAAHFPPPPGAAKGAVAYAIKLRDGALMPPSTDPASPEMTEYMASAVEFGVWDGATSDVVSALQAAVSQIYVPLLEPQLGSRGASLGGHGGDSRTIIGDTSHNGDSQSMVSGAHGALGAPSERSAGGATTLRGKGTSTVRGGGSVFAGGDLGGGGLARVVLPTPLDEERSVAGVVDSVRGEFRSAISRFSSVIAHTIQQLAGGGARLTLPADDLVLDSALLMEDDEARARVVELVEDWTKVIAGSTAPPSESAKGAKPLNEIECWRSRLATLQQLQEQLALSSVQAVVRAIEGTGEMCVEPFSLSCVGLTRAITEAIDNVKFLSTLERHFKTLSTAPLTTVLEALPSLLNGLRMVWVISRGYTTDEAMLPLLKRIATELADRVTSEIGSLKFLFNAAATEPADVISLLKVSISVLEGWRESYMATRERLELAGGDHHWEFDRRVLFERTDFIAVVVADLLYVIQTTAQLSSFIRGNELRALSNDPKELEALQSSIELLTKPFSRITWSPWEKARAHRWRAEVNSFVGKVEDVESRMQVFIGRCFEQLRSAEGAFDFLAKLSTIPMRDSLRRLLDGNAVNIVTKARAELADIVALFERSKDSPPVYKNAPPVAGAIAWANALYLRQKRPIVRIKSIMPALFELPEGAALRAEYLALARAVDAYVKGHFQVWCERVKRETADLLCVPVIGPALLAAPMSSQDVFELADEQALAAVAPYATAGSKARNLGKMTFAVAAAAAADTSLFKGDKMAPFLPPPPYVVNFSPSLSALIRESKLLDGMGFQLPEVALAVALADATLTSYVTRLGLMLERYHNTLATLSPVEAVLMQAQLARLKIAMRPGFSPLNWNSLHIGAYIDEVHRALNDFDSLLDQVRKSCSMLEDVTTAIQRTSLISAASFDGAANLDISETYDRIERQCASTLRSLVTRYASVRPIFKQIEGMIAGTDSAASPLLAEFYTYWERRFYNSITTMTLSSMATFEGLLNTISLPDGVSASQIARPALIRVRALFQPPPEVVLSPDINTVISKYLRKAGAGIIRGSSVFQRWMNGTCLPVEVSQLAPGEPSPDFSFLRDVSVNKEIVSMLTTYGPAVISVMNSAKAFMQYWVKVGSQYGLWSVRRSDYERRILDKSPPASYFDTRITSFTRLAEAVDTLPTSREIGFLRIDCSAITLAIKAQALKLKADNGRILHELSLRHLNDVRAKLAAFRTALDEQPTDLESLKAVLGTVASIMEARCDMEALISVARDYYSTLSLHGLAAPGTIEGSEAAMAEALPADWQALVDYGLTRDARLAKIKEKFRAQTLVDVEIFVKECDELAKAYASSGPNTNSTTLVTGVQLLAEYRSKYAAASKTREKYCTAERLFGLSMTLYPQLGGVKESIDFVSPLYELYAEQQAFSEVNAATAWADLDMGGLTRGAEELVKKLSKLKDLKASPIYALVVDEVTGFKDSLPLIASLKNPAMKERHWNDIGKLTGNKIPPIKMLTLGSIFTMQLARFAEGVEDICTQAKGELKIEKDMKSIEEKWKGTSFGLYAYKKNGETRGTLLRPDETLRQFLDDDLMNLSAISGSRFVPIFAAQVSEWDKKLNLVSETVEVWLVVQTKWAYLEGIFIGSEDIKMQLPEEAKRFATIDKDFKGIMTAVAKDPNVVVACCEPGRLALLVSLGERLDACQKSLSEYLYSKRCLFPRFFFLSDDELLSVLGSSDPNAIQVHLLKLFDNVKAFTISPSASGGNKLTVAKMTSSEGETFEMRAPSIIDGPVETWLLLAEAEMQTSLQAISKEAVFEYAGAVRTDWIDKVLGMNACVGSQIWWTWETEDTFRRVRAGDKYAMKVFAERQTKQLSDLVFKVRENIPRIMRAKVNTLLIIDIHARDIIDSFVRDSVLDAREFAWESQLRFYWTKEVDDIQIKQCTGSFRYGYEYMGLNGRLVITPLTDRCYMTLTQALTFYLGGSPAGPAGTGKTETVKDLAKNMALPCFVINCGEGLDYKAMGATFSGLCQVGAWGCFDEFNRINIEVLSVVSAQIRAIQNSLNYKKPTTDIGMGEIKVNAKVGIFITMNPGYAGRTELPDNLKALFRPVTMITPDLLQICEIMLFSEGFDGARVLAKKMTTLYRLAREQLSKQYHYDFGMRALKSVLVMAGSLKRESAELPEEIVLMRSLRDSNLPKFVFDDVPLFLGLIKDLFPGLDCPRVSYPNLKAAAEAEFEKLDMRHDDEAVFQNQVDAVIQLYEIILTRHTTMVVGPTGGGKSCCINGLQRASLAAFDKVIKISTVNPKAQTVNELYGVMDPATRDWTDGVLSKQFRQFNEPLPAGKENTVFWIHFDGDVDAVWVENMNSVMDDNKLLTLPNGERIRLQTYCKLIIEVFDLQYASPATISRCGMTYMDPKNLGFRPFYVRWAKQRCVAKGRMTELSALMDLFERYVSKMIAYVLEGDTGRRDANGQAPADAIEEPLALALPTASNLNMVKQLCAMLDAVLGLDTPAQEEQEPAVLEGLFLFAVTWSIGSLVSGSADRLRFTNFLKEIAKSVGAPLPSFSSSGRGKNAEELTFHDFFYDVETQKWLEWTSRVPEYAAPKPFEFSRIIVPTTDFVLFSWMINKLVSIDRPVLFVGDSGTAKTTTIASTLNSLDSDKYLQLLVNFSSRTTSRDVQTNIESATDKRSGKIYGPPVGKRLMVFVDDLNMPKIDKYGTQQPIALLHFLVGRSSMYDRSKDLDLRTYKDMQYVAGMQPPGGGKNPVDPRFLALFNSFCLTPPTQVVLTKIYNSILSNFASVFPPDVQSVASRITTATLQLYNTVCEKLPPTPAKFHYIFNLRDLGRVYEGLCQAVTDTMGTGPAMVRLWRNECTRIFGDRLISQTDSDFMRDLLADLIRQHFNEAATVALENPMLYGDFSGAVGRLNDGKEDARLYQDLGSFADIRKVLDQCLGWYNVEVKPMTLVLFEYALDHLTRLLRVLRMPRGNALLVGVGGSGKQSLTRLAAATAGCGIFEITLVRNYGEAEFREDLKNLYKKLMDGPMVFLFTDAHVVEEGFLELINNMLTSGMVPALYESDEKDALVNSVRSEVKARGMVDTKETCWSYLINKFRANLHLVLAMSPSGNTLRQRCRAFPGLVSASVIDWYFPWPEDALEKVAEFFLRDEQLPDELRKDITTHCVHVHTSVVKDSKRFIDELRRYNYVTPKNYLDFISNYRNQLSGRKKTLQTRAKRLETGLSKLIEAAAQVDVMSVELKAAKIVVDAKTIDVTALIEDISSRQSIADAQQAQATIKAKELEEGAVVIAAESAKATTALDAALPALEGAAAALDNLSAKDIGEIKSFANPPAPVKSVCLAVLVLRPNGTESGADWNAAKAMMSNGQFLQNLKKYNKDDIKGSQMKNVQKFFEDPEIPLSMESMQSVSKAGAGLLQWVIAIKEYYAVAKDVEPLRKKVADMERAQATGEKELADITKLLAKLGAELAELDVKYKAAAAELKDLSEKANLMQKRLAAANKLIVGLQGERVRWTADVERLGGNIENSTGDCLLAASFLSYLGPFTFDYRAALVNSTWSDDIKKRKIPLTLPLDLEGLLTTDATIQNWNADGLPSDPQSIWNGILTTKASRFPLCIDPQQQAVTWIKNREGANLRVATFLDSDFMQPLKLAIQYGKPFLFEAVDEMLDPMIDVVLEKLTFMDGAQRMINIDDKAIAWDDNFRMYLTSKLANPHYSPEVMGKTQIINFCVTESGLEGQLLNVVVGHERPDLATSWTTLVDEMSKNALMLEQLEEELLKNLSTSTGNILDNEELIATLDSAKTKSIEITEKLSRARLTKEEISQARAVYQTSAKRGSILYFVMAGLVNVNKMYEISLGSFLVVFKKALSNAKKAPSLEVRIKYMVAQMTKDMYDYTCTGIFERHKLMFSLQLTLSIAAAEGNMIRSELDFFLKGDTSIDAPKEPNPYTWLSKEGWKNLIKLANGLHESPSGPVFAELLAHLKSREGGAAWRAWYDLETPEMEALPGGFSTKLSNFQALCAIRCFRPDRVYNGVKRFVMGELGEAYVQPPVLDFSRIFHAASPTTPVIFILSPGADPQSDIQALGITMGFAPPTKFRFLAMGQGQAPKAEEMLLQGAQRGYWVLLQNTHLLIWWLKNLERLLTTTLAKPHPDFRLWMTTDPTESYPISLLQRSLKVVTEPPDGLKLNMRSSYAKLIAQANQEAGSPSMTSFGAGTDDCPHPAYRPLVYVLCMLHAVLLERRKFGRIGFNVSYDFNESDFNISRRCFALYLTKAFQNGDDQIPWSSLRYLIGEVQYGGRVSDSFDRRVLNTYLEEYMGDFLFDVNNKFFFARSGHDYDLPPAGTLDTYAEYVETLPLTNGPAVFGLHPNAEINMFTEAVMTMWSALIDMQPRTGGGGGGLSRDDIIASVVRDLSPKIPPPEDYMNIKKSLTQGGTIAPSPTSVVLMQELERWNKLVGYMAQSLIDLSRALIGEIGMSESLEELGNALFNGTIPAPWKMLAPQSEKPLGSWIAHFLDRHAQYVKWINEGDPLVIWLSGLHIPESYLTALVQVTCRRKGWALDRSTLFTVTTPFTDVSQVTERLEDGCYVRGLYLEGAGWDVQKRCLRPQDPKVLVVDLPILQVIPIEASRLQLAGTFRTPVYITQSRRNAMGVGLVFEADLVTHDHASKWTLQGVGLCLNIRS